MKKILIAFLFLLSAFGLALFVALGLTNPKMEHLQWAVWVLLIIQMIVVSDWFTVRFNQKGK